MTTGIAIGMAVGLAGLLWLMYEFVSCRFSSERTLHFRNGVCKENEVGVWKYLRYLGLKRELGKMLWPEGHSRVLTAEEGAYRPPIVDMYYWRSFPIWIRNRRPYGAQDTLEHHSFRYAIIAIAMTVASIVMSIMC